MLIIVDLCQHIFNIYASFSIVRCFIDLNECTSFHPKEKNGFFLTKKPKNIFDKYVIKDLIL